MWFPYHFPENIIRQPPVPHRRRSTTNEKAAEEERNTDHRPPTANEKAEEERNKEQQVGYCLRSGQRRKSLIMNMESSSSSLPDDAWFEILAHLPARDIYDLARLVCWKWYRMIYTHTFIYSNLQYTPYGLIFVSPDNMTFSVTMQQGRIETSKLSDTFIPTLWNTCNGLTVTRAPKSSKIYYIANPITEQVFALPPTPVLPSVDWFCGIGYASVSMEYKVVVTGLSSNGPWGIITPGVDGSWRVVSTDHFGLLPWIVVHPLITEGFMHWTFGGKGSGRKIGNQVLSLDLETEIVTKSCVPLDYDGECDHWNYLSTGRYLTLLITRGDCLWQVWEMKSGNGGGQWRKLDGVVIDLGTQMFEQYGFKLVPVGWLKYLELLVLRVSHSPIRVYNFLYNFLTKEIIPLELPFVCMNVNPVVHKNSLVWLAGC
ncbi:hypothetical protein CASFOL_013774 [Castilleja foliolosa]|uniref:F-box domain-containing protein n=1 Tax=Castilleja foliolosa TaxID=1961234 RepID=A0ABD3DM51_9LAMI